MDSGLTVEAIRAHLNTLILGRSIEVHRQVGSTNDLVREAARRGAPEGLVVVAEEQTQGRGRLGRTWIAPPGCCILCSVLLRPRFSPQHAFYLTIATSLAIHRACKTLLTHQSFLPQGPTSNVQRPKCSIKWPNDILVNGRKIAGVLSESELSGENWLFSVVGFGINVNLRPGDLGELRDRATSLSIELDREIDRAALLACVLTELEGIYLTLQNGQFGAVHSEWAAMLETVGKRVQVQDGTSIVEGRALRIDPDGALVLRLDDGEERRFISGDVG